MQTGDPMGSWRPNGYALKAIWVALEALCVSMEALWIALEDP